MAWASLFRQAPSPWEVAVLKAIDASFVKQHYEQLRAEREGQANRAKAGHGRKGRRP